MLELKIQRWMYADGNNSDTDVLITLLNVPHHDITDKILFSLDLEEENRKGVMDALRAIQEDLMAF